MMHPYFEFFMVGGSRKPGITQALRQLAPIVSFMVGGCRLTQGHIFCILIVCKINCCFKQDERERKKDRSERERDRETERETERAIDRD